MPPETVALIGVTVGAFLSWVGASLTERARFNRAQSVHWRDQRLEAYTQFAAATKSYMGTLFRVGGGLRIDDQTETLALEDAAPLLADAFRDREIAFEKMRLVGSDETCSAARSWVRSIYEMRDSLEQENLTSEDWSELVRRANVARDVFAAAARSDLNISPISARDRRGTFRRSARNSREGSI